MKTPEWLERLREAAEQPNPRSIDLDLRTALDAIEGMREALEALDKHCEECIARGVGYDSFAHSIIRAALKLVEEKSDAS